jgi:hypothetical protein
MNFTEGQDFYFWPNSTAAIKSRKIKFAGYVARIGEEKCIQDFVMET